MVYKWRKSFTSHALLGIAVDSMSLQQQQLAWLQSFMSELPRCLFMPPHKDVHCVSLLLACAALHTGFC